MKRSVMRSSWAAFCRLRTPPIAPNRPFACTVKVSRAGSSEDSARYAVLPLALALPLVLSAMSESKAEEENPVLNAVKKKQKLHYPYVIVGAGTTANAAIEAIRQGEPDAEILILSEETTLPRPDLERDQPESTLSDELMETFNEWRRHVTSRLETNPEAYSSGSITLLLGKRNISLDVENNRISFQDGAQIHYDKCLIASAGKPRSFYVLDSTKISYSLKSKINALTGLQDFQDLQNLSSNRSVHELTVIGGGFLGTEIACTLATSEAFKPLGLKIKQVFVENAPLSRHLPGYLCDVISRRMKGVGIGLVADRLVTGIKAEDATDNPQVIVSLLGYEKEKISTDYVVLASTHIDPRVKFARESGLEIDAKSGGVVVNSQFEAMSGLYVAGTSASYYDQALGRRRVDMYDHAVNSGLQAGQNMVAGLGRSKIYTHQPMMRSNMPGIGLLIEAVGEIDANLKTVGVFLSHWNKKSKSGSQSTPDYDRGIVYYLQGNRVVGILLWNAPDALERARMVLNQRPIIQDPADLKSQISLAPDSWLDVIVSQ